MEGECGGACDAYGREGNQWRVLIGKPEGKITTARHEYRHLPSAVNSLIRVNLIVF
jgi:hypothetical protein